MPQSGAFYRGSLDNAAGALAARRLFLWPDPPAGGFARQGLDENETRL